LRYKIIVIPSGAKESIAASNHPSRVTRHLSRVTRHPSLQSATKNPAFTQHNL